MASGNIFARLFASIILCLMSACFISAHAPNQGRNKKTDVGQTSGNRADRPVLTAEQLEDVRRIAREETDRLKAELLRDFVTKEQLPQSEYVDAFRKSLADLAERVEGIDRRLAVVENAFQNETELLQRRVSSIDERLDRVLTSDSLDKAILAIRGQMGASEEFRKQFGEAVSDTRTGILTIRNLTDHDQELYVNGKRQAVALFQTIKVSVPVGAVVTELWPHERPKIWVLNAANEFKQEIKIYPRAGPPAPSPFADPPDRGMKPE